VITGLLKNNILCGAVMQVLEIYQSKQGEGLWTGKYSVFVRMLGCPLRCRYCDTPYARSDSFDPENSSIGADLSPDELAGRVLLLELPHVVLTGGEPMLSPEIVELTKLLKDFDNVITIETSGIIDRPVICDLMSISPKLRNALPPNASLQEYSRPDIVQQLILRYEYQLKFVADTPDDLPEIAEYLTQLQGVRADRVLIMPQAVDTETMHRKSDWIIPFCEEHGYRYCPRMQIVWYGNKRRT
jgi:7-carboxy-7-deazaguanine synthase